MDQLSAHLERGWDLAQRGDTNGAGASARRALELKPDSPEVHNLLGFVAAIDGDCDEAIEAYQAAIDLDDNYVEAMLNAAELMVHPLGHYDDAIHMCDQVLDMSEFSDEIIDALLLKFDALMAKGDRDDAKTVLSRLPKGPHENPAHNYLAGRAHFDVGETKVAAVLIGHALAGDPHNAEAHYYAGLLCEDKGDTRGACAAFLRTRQLELEMGMPPWSPNGETFLMFTDKAIGQLDEELRTYMANAELYIADLPGPEVIIEGVDPRSTTLIDAVLLGPDDDASDLEINAEQVGLRIFMYAMNIMRAASGLHAVQQTIFEALDTEVRATLAELKEELAAELEEAVEEPDKMD
jgi:Flp pilus assembly protein TadD